MVTLVWNRDDVLAIYASLFEKEDPFRYMEMPHNILGCLFADKVAAGADLIGISTSRCYSYYFREMLSLCSIDLKWSASDTEVSVIWGRPGGRQKLIRARVAPAPYKRDNRRIDVRQLRQPS